MSRSTKDLKVTVDIIGTDSSNIVFGFEKSKSCEAVSYVVRNLIEWILVLEEWLLDHQTCSTLFVYLFFNR